MIWFPPRRSPATSQATTPAKAGVQLGDGYDDALRTVTSAIPIGPRPSPGWCPGVGRAVGRADQPVSRVATARSGSDAKRAAPSERAARCFSQQVAEATVPRRRPGSSWAAAVTARSTASVRPSHLGPGLRRGTASASHSRQHIREGAGSACPPHRLSGRAGRRRGVAVSGDGRGVGAAPDRRGRNARRSTGSPDSPCRRKSGNRAHRDGRAAICRCGR